MKKGFCVVAPPPSTFNRIAIAVISSSLGIGRYIHTMLSFLFAGSRS